MYTLYFFKYHTLITVLFTVQDILQPVLTLIFSVAPLHSPDNLLIDNDFGLFSVAVNLEVFRAATSWAPHEHLVMAKDSRVQVKAGIFIGLSLGLITGQTKYSLDGKLHLLEFHKAVWWDQAYSRYQYLLSCGHPRQDPCNNDVLHEAFNNQARSIHEPGSVKVAQQDNGTSLL